jgi:transforming growth factor-beta-induced protein
MTGKAVDVMNQMKINPSGKGFGRLGLTALACIAVLGLTGCEDEEGGGAAPPKNDAGTGTVADTRPVPDAVPPGAADTSPPAPVDIVATAQAAGTFNTLAAALTAAELLDVLKGMGPFTVFAPTDTAFANLPAGTLDNLLKPENKAQLQAVLKYHVVAGKVLAADVVKLTSATTLEGSAVKVSVSGSTVMINDSKVTQADVMASNGVIHVIDAVLLPPAKPMDIVATAQAAGTFNTLAAALTAAELLDVLKGTGPFTVFAPTDTAFAKLPAGTLDNLLKPENKAQLQAVLKYHVVAGKVLAADVVKLTSATTLEGSAVKVSVSGSTVMINDGKVTQADVMASNGVIHVIDAVLLPRR